MATKQFQNAKLNVTHLDLKDDASRSVLQSGENISHSLGKIARWYKDIIWTDSKATTEVFGIVKLSDDYKSESTETVPTSKTLNDVVKLIKQTGGWNTTYDFNLNIEGDENLQNGQFKVTEHDLEGDIDHYVSIKGLGSAAFTDSNEYATSGHTHLYAGSDTVGGAATSANKLNTDAGSTANPVYFKNGIPVACTYSLNSTVPSDAVFTDTTYIIESGDSNGQIKVTPSVGDPYNVSVKGLGSAAYTDKSDYATAEHIHKYAGSDSVGGAATSANKLNTDAGSDVTPIYFSNGIPVACTYSLNKTVPSNALFTDAKVKQTATTTDADYEILFSSTADNTTRTEGTRKNSNLTFNPSTGVLTATKFVGTLSGNATTATTANKLSNTTAIGSSIKPVYFSADGIPVAIDHSIETSVPSNAVFTDTTYTVSSGDNNGQIKVTPSEGDPYNVSVKGLGSAAYTDSDEYATANHTHKYAGSSTAGGVANSAAKLSDIPAGGIGSETKPVFFSGTTGRPVACTYSLNTTVPANAIFTDDKVKQSPVTMDGSFEVLFAGSTGNTVKTEGVGKTTTLTFNPSTGALSATSFSGNGSGLTSLNATNISSGTLAVNRLPGSAVTIGTYGPAAGGTLSHSGTFDVPDFTVDAKGRITGAHTRTFTLPAQYTHPSHTSKASGLYKITVDSLGHVSGTAAVTKSDIPALDYISSTTTRNPNVVLAGPASGTAAAAPTFRTLVVADLPASGATAGSYGPSANATPGYGSTFNVPYITVDAKGRVTGIENKTVKIPASDNTDTKVTQTATTTSAAYEVLFSGTADNTTRTEGARKSNNLLFNPSTGVLQISGTEYGAIEIYRKGSAYGAAIEFYNDATNNTKTKLGSICMKDVDGDIIRYLANDSTTHKICDTKNTSFTRSLSSGTKIGTITIAGTSTDLYCQTNTNTTYSFATGDTNGTFKVTPSGGTATNIAIKGLGSAAYTASSAYATAGHTHSYLPLSGGTMTGDITFAGVSSTEYPALSNQIYFSGSTDWARILYEVTASDAGQLVFETGDDANAKIVFRNKVTSGGTYTRQVTIADGVISGNGSGLTSLNASNISSGTLSADRLATSGATAGSYGPSANATPGYGSTFNVPYITVDNKGRVTAISTKTVKIPASDNTNTTYTFATGDNNGTFKVTPSGGTATNIAIKGLGSAAYTASSAYAAASHTHNYAGSSTAGGPATLIAMARVKQDSKVFPGQNRVKFEEYTAGDSYNLPTNAWYHIISMQGADTRYGTQIAIGMTTNKRMYFRNYNESSWQDWTRVSIDGHTHSYLPLAGGTMTGNIEFGAVTSTTYPAESKGLIFSGSTDGASIFYRVIASDQGELVLKTRDDGNCIIRMENSLPNAKNTIKFDTYNSYIYSNYFNAGCGAETPNTSSYIIYANSDGWLRKSTLANIKTILGLGSAAYTASSAYAAAGHAHGLGHSNFTVAINSTTNTWAAIGVDGTNKYVLKSIRTNTNAPPYLLNDFSAGIVFGGEDTRGVISMKYDTPSIRFAGGNRTAADGGTAVWYITLTGTHNTTYNLNTMHQVTQSATSTANFRGVILGTNNTVNTGDTRETTVTGQGYITNKIFAQPSTGNLYASNIYAYVNGTDEVRIALYRSGNSSWRFVNNGGTLSLQNNYYSDKVQSWYNVAQFNYGGTNAIKLMTPPQLTGTNRSTTYGYSTIDMAICSKHSWAMSMRWLNNARNAVRGSFGAYGTADNLTYYYWGNEYNSTKLRLYPGTGGGLVSQQSNGFRIATNGYGVIFRVDSDNFYILLTDKKTDGSELTGDNWNSKRPLQIGLSSGVCNINGTAATAKKLKYCTLCNEASDAATYPWYRMAYAYTTNAYSDLNLVMMVTCGYSSKWGIFKARARTEGTAGTFGSTVTIDWIVNHGFTNAQLYLLVKNNYQVDTAKSGTATAEIWFKSDGRYYGYTFTVLHEGRRDGTSSDLWALSSYRVNGSESYNKNASGIKAATSKSLKTATTTSNTGWTNNAIDDNIIPTMSFMAYWNGRYNSSNSNLQYCDRGRFGTIITAGSGDYVKKSKVLWTGTVATAARSEKSYTLANKATGYNIIKILYTSTTMTGGAAGCLEINGTKTNVSQPVVVGATATTTMIFYFKISSNGSTITVGSGNNVITITGIYGLII